MSTIHASRRTRRLATVATLGALLTTLVAVPAAAHVTAIASTTAAGSRAIVHLRVPHGCGDSPTEKLEVQIPAGVVSVKPEQTPGWDIDVEIGPLDEPYDNHGTLVTEDVKVVTWTAQPGNALPNSQFRDFGLQVRFPDAEGETLAFAAIQTCTNGETEAWIEVSDDPDASLDMPAPTVTLTAASGGGHGASSDPYAGSDTEGGDDHGAEQTSGTSETVTVTPAASDAPSSPHALTYVALVVGALGLVAGGLGLRASRRTA